jgi:hypothetical protein
LAISRRGRGCGRTGGGANRCHSGGC